MNDAVRAPLIAIAASVGLIAMYLAFGGATYDPAEVADPCETRDAATLQDRDLFESIALSSLDGAACELRVSREELTLALADEAATEEFAEAHGVDSETVEDAVQAGLVRSVDDAIAAGEIDGFEAELLREVAERVPVGLAIDGLQSVSDDDSIQGLLELLGGIEGLELPGLGELPSTDELEGLLP
jgi:hypothetical protein